MEIENAVILSASVEIEEHNLLTMWVQLDYGNSGQGFGGYALAGSQKTPGLGAYFIRRVLEIAGVRSVQALAGKTLRVRRDDTLGPITAIGHIVKDDWFEPSKDLQS